MENLLVMSLSGTTMTVICLFIRYRFKDTVSNNLEYLLNKLSILFYIVPLPFLGEYYKDMIWSAAETGGSNITELSLHHSYYLINVNGQVLPNTYLKIQAAVTVVWIVVSIIFFIRELCDYQNTGNMIRNYIKKIKILPESVSVERGNRFLHFSQRATVYQKVPAGKNMTFGLLRPVILFGLDPVDEAAKTVLEHEIMHVRRLDIFWKMLLRFAVILHCWNPFVWFLNENFERVCECSCDEAVLQGKTIKERKDYLRLMVCLSQKEGTEEMNRSHWEMRLESDRKLLEERIESAMNIKKHNKIIGIVIAVVLMTLNSVTALAYPRVYTETCKEEESEEQIELELRADILQFVPNGINEESTYAVRPIEILYEEQFIDTQGNIFPVKDTVDENLYRSCNHNYVSGTEYWHTKNSDGSCKLTAYSTERCSKCDDVVRGNRLYEGNYNICPH